MEQKVMRNFDFEVRAEQDEKNGKFLCGRPIVFNAPTDVCGRFQEVISTTALSESDLRDVRFLVNHNTNMIPLARSRRNNANSTMQMEVDDAGMAIRVNLDTENNEQARALYSATERGDISGMSFMFTIDDVEWSNLETEYPTRTIRKIGKVFEVSAVTFPAYEQTSLEARDAEALESAKAALESVKAEQRCEEARERIRKILGGTSDADC